MTEKNPWVSAILNFFIWGAGYIYNGSRAACMHLLEKVSNKIGGYYRGYSSRVRDFPVGQRNILETS